MAEVKNMKMFDLKGVVLSLNTPNINSLLQSIELYRGKTMDISRLKKVEKLTNIAVRSAVVASNEIGSVTISDSREEAIFVKGQKPETLQEHMLVGYRNALDLIAKVNKFQTLDRSFISTLHYYIYKDYNPEFGGQYKDSQNYIQEVKADGSLRTIFVTAAPEEVVPLLDNLVYQYNVCAADEEINKLLLIAVFMFDFMCIHPYNHGNGRLSRLLLNFLMKKNGYEIGDYFGIPNIMRHRISDYIDSFESSSKGWNENENDYTPFVTFILKCVLEAYRKLDYIMDVNLSEGTAEEKVLRIINDSATPINKEVVQNVLYAASPATIEKALATLVKDVRIQLITKGRYSKYFRI